MGFTSLDVRSQLSASFLHSKRSDFVHDSAVFMFMYTHILGQKRIKSFRSFIHKSKFFYI